MEMMWLIEVIFFHFFMSDKRLAYKNFKGRLYWKNGTLDSRNVQL
jgi:hypothetical protein